MKRTALIFLLMRMLLLSAQAQSVSFVWARHFLDSTVASGWSVVTNSNGDVYTTGSFEYKADFDPGTVVYNLSAGGKRDIFISKLDSAGNFSWAKQLKGTNTSRSDGRQIALDASGNIYITGWFQGTVDFDPGPANYSLTTNGTNVFILKLDPNGNFIWVKQLNAASPVSIAHSIALDVAGNIYITGYFATTIDFDPGPSVYLMTPTGFFNAFLLKLDANGNFSWAKSFGTGTNIRSLGYSVKVDSSGNVYTVGEWLSGLAADFDPGPGVFTLTANSIQPKIFISKLDALGNFVWANQLLPTSNMFLSSPTSMVLDKQSNIYISGGFSGTMDVDPGPGIYYLYANSSIANNVEGFAAKFDSACNLLWATNAVEYIADPVSSPNITATALAVDSNDNVCLAGYFSGSVDINPGPGTQIFTAAPGSLDAYVSRFTSDGTFVWAKQLKSTLECSPASIHIDGAGNVYTTGNFIKSVDFDPGPGIYTLDAPYTQINNSSFGSVFILKMGPCIGSSSVINATSCKKYALNNEVYNSSGTYTQTLEAASGCDSVITLHLVIQPAATSFDSVTTCNAYNWNGQLYMASGIYNDTLTNDQGCDSIATLYLTINPLTFSTTNIKLCAGQVYQGHTKAGIYVDTLIAANGCDSLSTLNLGYQPWNSTSLNAVICPGESYFGYKKTGLYLDTLNGCVIRKITLAVERDCSDFGMPDAFSPNGDGLNDLFKPVIRYRVQRYNFIVYNRWGAVVFKTSNPSAGWDGTLNGKPQPDGAYVFQVSVEVAGSEKVKKGTVQLIR